MDVFGTLARPIVDAFDGIEVTDLPFVAPPNLDLGDVALRTFEAARKLKTAPTQLATRIAREVVFGPEVAAVSTAGPYVNFRLNRSLFAHRIVAGILGEGKHFGSNDSGVGKRVLIEHTSITPTASPHLGRARNAMIGDSVTRLLRFEGYDVEVHYYVNDMGRQIGLLVLICDDVEHLMFDHVLNLYVEANARAEAAAARANMAQAGVASTQTSFHTIQAPYAGVIAEVACELGDTAAPGKPKLAATAEAEGRPARQRRG